jgi:hypothetical protein
MAYATRHPTHPAKLILISTEAAGGTHKERRVAMFEKLGGPEVGGMARRRMFEGHSDKASLDAWLRLAFPLYTRTPREPDVVRRAVGNQGVLVQRRTRICCETALPTIGQSTLAPASSSTGSRDIDRG